MVIDESIVIEFDTSDEIYVHLLDWLLFSSYATDVGLLGPVFAATDALDPVIEKNEATNVEPFIMGDAKIDINYYGSNLAKLKSYVSLSNVRLCFYCSRHRKVSLDERSDEKLADRNFGV